jgi:hypothetical protein
MLQEPATKDVFRELDGFVVLMSVLCTVNNTADANTTTTSASAHKNLGPALAEILHNAHLVFLVLSEAMNERPENTQYFNVSTPSHPFLHEYCVLIMPLHIQTRVGYDVLAQAIHGLLSDVRTQHTTLGLLLALALHDFSLSTLPASIFAPASVNTALIQFESQTLLIQHSGAVRLLWDVIFSDPAGAGMLDSGPFIELFNILSRASHRNQVVLSSIGLVTPLFHTLHPPSPSPSTDATTSINTTSTSTSPATSPAFASSLTPTSPAYRSSQQKLLKTLLEAGTTTSDARTILRRVISADGGTLGLDAEVLEIVRAGMKARWPLRFSMVHRAALVLSQDGMRGMPVGGFTYMVSTSPLFEVTSRLPSFLPFAGMKG